MKQFGKLIKCSIAGAMVALLCFLAVMSASAAIDPPMGISGNEPGGVMVVDGQTELALESAELEFDISDLPDGVIDDAEQLLSYGTQVRATYTVYNPTDRIVTEQLATPLGCYPYFDQTENEEADAYKFTVEINGQKVETDQCHTYYPDPSYYMQGLAGDTRSLASGLAYLPDQGAAHPVLQPDAPVYVYTYLAALSSDDAEDKSFEVSGSINADPDACAVLVAGLSVTGMQGDTATLYSHVYMSDELTVCSVGADVGEIDWLASDYKGNKVEAGVTLTSRQTMTLYEYVMQGYDPECGASEQDYFLAVVAYADNNRALGSAVTCFGDAVALEPYNLIPWQLFDVTLAPGERASITVSAPIYPYIHDHYNPPVYTYAFAMTQDDAWSSCGTTRVRVITDLLLSHRERMLPEIDAYTETEDGYLWEGQGDFHYLVFSICQSEKPRDQSLIFALLAGLFIIALLFVIFVLPVLIVIAVLVLIILLILRAKKRKKKRMAEQSMPTEHPKEEENNDA
ncbi:MAG: hypothetical protein IJW70_10465 [Clostridia bacterium]|nr:hypothetical protein [Clostridia bacterium]